MRHGTQPEPISPTSELILTAAQAAKLLGVTTDWIYLHKELPSLRVGKFLRFNKQDLLSWMRKQSLRGK